MGTKLEGPVGRIENTFAARKAQGKRVLMAYLAVGDPSLDESADLILACVEAGADVIELGVPFSDPTADGPAIARASQRAIQAGGGLSATLQVAKKVRKACDASLVLFGYYNPLFVRGEARAVDEASEAGIDGLLVVDLPLGEGRELRERARERNIAVVPLLAPTSLAERIKALKAQTASHPAGFVYYVSVTGVTGSNAAPLAEASIAAANIRQAVGLPTVVGFGIDSPKKAQTAAASADGIVVGTALVRLVDEGKTADERKRSVFGLVQQIRNAIDAPGANS